MYDLYILSNIYVPFAAEELSGRAAITEKL
jgi:hypothetical protein